MRYYLMWRDTLWPPRIVFALKVFLKKMRKLYQIRLRKEKNSDNLIPLQSVRSIFPAVVAIAGSRFLQKERKHQY